MSLVLRSSYIDIEIVQHVAARLGIVFDRMRKGAGWAVSAYKEA